MGVNILNSSVEQNEFPKKPNQNNMVDAFHLFKLLQVPFYSMRSTPPGKNDLFRFTKESTGFLEPMSIQMSKGDIEFSNSYRSVL